ncbi:MAG TPA: universal stress protein [Pyrinomonadaceae bacterium]
MKIILATDGSACSEVAVREVARRPWPEDSQVRVIGVAEIPAQLAGSSYMLMNDYFTQVERAKEDEAREAVEGAKAALAAGEGSRGLQISTEVVKGSPKRVIVEEAERWGADLIVVGSHGYKSWERMLLGSVSQCVALHAPCTVEIVRCRQQQN